MSEEMEVDFEEIMDQNSDKEAYNTLYGDTGYAK